MFHKIKWVADKASAKLGQLLLRRFLLPLKKNLLYGPGVDLFGQPGGKTFNLGSTFAINETIQPYPALETAVFEDCTIFGKARTPLVQGKIALQILSTPNYSNPSIHLNFLDLLLTAKVNKKMPPQPGIYFLMVNRWSKNYHHWLCEFLPALVAARKLISGNIIPIVDAVPTRFQTETLRLLGFDTARLERKTNIRVERLAAVKNIRMRKPGWKYSIIEPTMLAKMRAQILPNIVTPANTNVFDVLWISRQDDGNRHVVNEQSLFAQANIRIKVIYPGRTSINDQIYFSSIAKIIAGPHGAGLSNAVWAKKCALIEVGPAGGINNSFVGLATSLGAGYQYVTATTEGFHLQSKRKNLLLDVPAFVALVGEMIAKPTGE